MMTKEEYEKKIAELQAQIDELRNERIEATKIALPTPPHPRWIPEDRGCYYYLDEGGWITETNREGFLLKDKYKIGNVFKTIDAANFAAERLKVLAEMREWAGNWHDRWRLYYCDGRIEPEAVYIGEDVTYGEMRFASEADARNCINAVGEERLKKYYFLMPEVHECCTSES